MQRFGGTWTLAKLEALGNYLRAYTTALKFSPFKLIYIDAFAGSGHFVPTKGAGFQPGSARMALEVPGFHEYFFIEKNVRRCEKLRRVTELTDRKSTIFAGDANQHLQSLCNTIPWRSSRAVLFLDPYGLQVDWATLEQIQRTRAIDVWYLFPLSGITRQLALDESRIDDDKRRSLTRIFGTDTWREAFYDIDPLPDLFGGMAVKRHADVDAITRWVTSRLQGLFPLVVGPVILRKGTKTRSDQGPALFALYFLMSNPASIAQQRAKAIADGVIKKLQREAGVGA